MNERSEYRNQNAEAPTTSAFDAPQVPPGIAPAANDEGASAGVISHNAPRQLNPMGKAIAVVLSVLLVLTCWNSYSIEEARRMIIGDDAVPMASTGSGDELLDEVDDENIDQASNDVEGEGDAAEGDDASGGKDADDTAADDTVSEGRYAGISAQGSPRCREGHAGARRRYPEAGKGRHPRRRPPPPRTTSRPPSPTASRSLSRLRTPCAPRTTPTT